MSEVSAGNDISPAVDGERRFGLALGGGGARGLAHIPMLEALDELGIVPRIIAGTSIGSLIGAAYASGMSGADIRRYCQELFQGRTEILKRLFSHWNGDGGEADSLGNGSIFAAENILGALLPETLRGSFETLKIPLIAVATDFYQQSQLCLDKGPLIPAIAASCALPGIIRPIELGGRVLIDGGFVNPVPFDLIEGHADIIAAIDVSAGPQQSRGKMPSLIEAVIGANQITLRSVLREKLKSSAPHILIRPNIGHFRVLEFYKIGEIFAAAETSKDEFKRVCEQAFSKQ